MLNYYGMLGRPHSWAEVSQSLLLEFQKQGIELRCKSTNKPDGIHPDLLPTLIQNNQPIPQSDVSFSYTLPINLARINANHRIVIANHDNSILPQGWSHLFNTYAHLILPSSKFAYDVLEQNGIKKEKMVVVPHGYNPSIFNPDVLPSTLDNTPDDRFKFLMVAAPHWRKGHDIMMRAFIEEFKNDEDVVLIIKSSMNSHEAPAHFHVDLSKIKAELELSHKYKWPSIKLINYSIPSLAGLYKYVDAVVLPSRAECFSLTVLESAMVKTPVITTEYGGHLDFLNQENSYLIDYVLKKCPKEGQYHQFTPNSLIAEPSIEHLKQLMRHVKNNHQEAKQKAELCYEQNKHLTWENAATQIINLINDRGWKL